MITDRCSQILKIPLTVLLHMELSSCTHSFVLIETSVVTKCLFE